MDQDLKIPATGSEYSLLKLRLQLSYKELTRLLTVVAHNEKELSSIGVSAIDLSYSEASTLLFKAELNKGRSANARISWQPNENDPFGKFTVTDFKISSSKTLERIIMPLVKSAVNPIVKKRVNEVLDDLSTRITGEIKSALLANIHNLGVGLDRNCLNVIWRNESLDEHGLTAMLIIISDEIPVWNPKDFDWEAVLAPIEN